MNIRRFRLWCVLCVAGLLAGCTPYAKVVERPYVLRPVPAEAAALTNADSYFAAAQKATAKQPLNAMGEYLAAAEVSAARLQTSPGDPVALRDYNFAVSRVFSVVRTAKMDPWAQPLRVPGPRGEYVLWTRVDPKLPERNPALFDYIPVDQLEITGSYMTERTIKAGLGAPLVAVRREVRTDARQRFALPRAYYGLTAVARFTGHRCEITFEDPLAKEDTRLGSRTFSLGADFTAPFALMLRDSPVKKIELLNLLRPRDPAAAARIVKLQPFDPEKTTVLVVHGLASSPSTWVPMLSELRGDPEIRKHYQFWFFEYPSGYPYPYSAAALRHELDAALKVFPQRKPMVFIGHSMGGMISRLMITDSGEKLWDNFTGGRSPDKLAMSASSKKVIEDALIFKHRSEVGRVIFIASPHRGSDLATNWLSRLGSRLIKAPFSLLKVATDVTRAMVTLNPGETQKIRVPTSVDTLSPENRFVKAVNTIPITPGIPYHSIIGDRGKGDTPDSSDGLVPYWSSHLDGAQSELIVPSHHSAHQNPQAIAEVDRILKLNCGLRSTAKRSPGPARPAP